MICTVLLFKPKILHNDLCKLDSDFSAIEYKTNGTKAKIVQINKLEHGLEYNFSYRNNFIQKCMFENAEFWRLLLVAPPRHVMC